MVKDVFLHNGGKCNVFVMSHIQTTQDIFNLLKGPDPTYRVLTFGNILITELWAKMWSVMTLKGQGYRSKQMVPT